VRAYGPPAADPICTSSASDRAYSTTPGKRRRRPHLQGLLLPLKRGRESESGDISHMNMIGRLLFLFKVKLLIQHPSIEKIPRWTRGHLGKKKHMVGLDLLDSFLNFPPKDHVTGTKKDVT
jgi:hypothetical protein